MRTILFAPQAETSRDLTYSEEASCCYSLHLLIQDKGLSGYDIILEAYRAAIKGFLNFKNIKSAELFLDSLVSELDLLTAGRITAAEGLDKIGFHLLLSTCERIYVLTSDASRVWLGEKGDYRPITRPSGEPAFRWKPTPTGRTQPELFPTRFSDRLSLYEVDYPRTGVMDFVAGCDETEGEEIFRYLGDVAGTGKHSGLQATEIKYARNKILAVSFSARQRQAILSASAQALGGQGGSGSRHALSVALISAATLLVLIGAYLGSEKLRSGPAVPEERLEPRSAKARQAAMTDRANRASEQAKPAATEAVRDEPRFVLRWKKEFSRPVTSSPLLTADLVVFGCRDGNLYALDPSSGQVAWKFVSGAGIGASPAGDPSHIVSADYKGTVACLDPRDGSLLWKRKLPAKIVSSPILAGMKVFIGCYDRGIYCLSLGNGEILWKTKVAGIIRANPAHARGMLLFPSYDGHLYALTAGTGKLGWKYKLGGSVSSSPVAGREIVVAAAPDGSIRAFTTATGVLRWEKKLGAPVKSGLAMNGGTVVFGANDGRVRSLALRDGSVQWVFETGDIVLSRPRIVEKKMFVGSYDGFMYMLDAATGDLLDRFDAGSPVFSSPAAANGLLFFGDNGGDFYCLRYAQAFKS